MQSKNSIGKNLIGNKQVQVFNSTLLNTFSNFIPNKYMTINNKDPPWMNNHIRTKINRKNLLFKTFLRSKKLKISDFNRLESARLELSELIIKSKEEYYSRLARRLNNPTVSSKTYWSIIKTFFNGKKTSTDSTSNY